MDQEVNKNEKKNKANIQPTWPSCVNEGSIIQPKRKQDGTILPSHVANQKTGLASSYMLLDSAIYQYQKQS